MAESEADARRQEPGADALIGTVVNGRFHILRRIARGGMGSVYFATQAPLSRPVAIKVLHVGGNIDAEADEDFRRRFLREASILAKLQHPNIVMLLDYGQITDLPGAHYYMAMEYLRGETLAQRFRTRGRLTIAESVRIARQIGRGLREAHKCGVIHRDLKPSNIMLVPEDEKNDIVKLVDFGIGKIIAGRTETVRDSGDDVTRAGRLLGSPRYMSPEQIRSEPVEPRTDLYGLGVILFQALTGRLPFEARTSFDTMLFHCLVPPPELSDSCPDQVYPDALSKLVRSLLEKHAEGRPTAEEFLQRLAVVEEAIFGTTALAGAITPTSPPVAASRRDAADATGSSRRLAEPAWVMRTPPPASLEGSPPAVLAPPPRPAPRRTTVAVLALFGLLALFVPVALAFFAGPKAHVAPASAPSVAATAPESQREVKSFPLTIESVPPGANVMEDGRVLGVTPLTMTIERRSVMVEPRKFTLERDGYASHTLEQRDSETAVRASAILAPLRVAPARPAQWNPAPQQAREVSVGKRNEGDRLEIRLRR